MLQASSQREFSFFPTTNTDAGVNQSYENFNLMRQQAGNSIGSNYSSNSNNSNHNMSLEEEFNRIYSLPASNGDIDNFPLHHLWNSEWLQQNISQMLNISVDNLTTLLQNHADADNKTEERLAMQYLAPLTIFYVLIFVAGVLGNLITCIVISRNKFMHTATNFYLFNLAVSDLILLVSGKFKTNKKLNTFHFCN